MRCRQDARERLSEHVAIVSFTAPVIDARPAARSPARFFDGAPPLRNQKFADSPVEGDGFELPVPRCARPADSAVLAVSPDSVVSSSSWNGPLHSIGCQGRQLLGCHRRAYGRSAPSRTKPENCCLSGAELKVRIHLPPAVSLRTIGSRNTRSVTEPPPGATPICVRPAKLAHDRTASATPSVRQRSWDRPGRRP